MSRDTDKAPRVELRIGEPFKPHELHARKEFPADIVDRVRGIGDGPKRLYRRLIYRAGTNGACFPSLASLANDLGKSERQIRNDMSALETLGLIRVNPRAYHKSNIYEFLWNDILERQPAAIQNNAYKTKKGRFERQPAAAQKTSPTGFERQPAEFERQPAEFERKDQVCLSGSLLPTNQKRKDSKKQSSSSGFVQTEERATDDDDSSSEENESPSEVWFVGEALEKARKVLLATASVRSPNVAETSEQQQHRICCNFRNLAHFEAWARSAKLRVLKCKGNHGNQIYAFLATDARENAPDAERAIEAERFQAQADKARAKFLAEAEAEKTRRDNTPIEVQSAIGIYSLENCWTVSKRSTNRLERIGPEITPTELARRLKLWGSCGDCDGTGLIGSALKRTLRYCACDAGQVDQRTLDGSHITAAIDETHKSFRSRLQAALHEIGANFTADLVESMAGIRITETDAKVLFILESNAWNVGDRKAFAKAMTELSDPRMVEVEPSDECIADLRLVGIHISKKTS